MLVRAGGMTSAAAIKSSKYASAFGALPDWRWSETRSEQNTTNFARREQWWYHRANDTQGLTTFIHG